MYPALRHSIDQALARIPSIPAERRQLLDTLADFMAQRIREGRAIRTNTICTHNSRRSHLGQVWIQTLAHHFGIPMVEAFSGGTEATACHPNTIAALQAQGFAIHKGEGENPVYELRFDEQAPAIRCWSKRFDDPANPKDDFAAIMVCGSADGACPVVSGSALRLSCTYVDPKVSDGTPEQDATYQDRSLQIASEMAYALCKAGLSAGQKGEGGSCCAGTGCCG